MEEAVERAVTVIRSRYQEHLSVADLAAEAFFSPFHFSRVFRRELGVSPCHYLTAVRLFEAKRLLHGTSLNVADIACRVGYVGIGTFTTRFTAMVGVPPGHYRRLPTSRMLLIADGVRQLPDWDVVPAGALHRSRPAGRGGTIVGSARPAPAMSVSRIFVGAFDDTIPQGPPAAWALVPGADSGQWRLDDVPPGQWVVIALVEGHSAVPENADPENPARAGATFYLGVSDPVQVRAGAIARVRLRMRRPHRTDPPILIPMCHRLPALRSVAS
jgi:AraC family transcriptional regulator